MLLISYEEINKIRYRLRASSFDNAWRVLQKKKKKFTNSLILTEKVKLKPT